MFNIGDKVVYASNGVCTVSDIKEERFSGSANLYYILSPHTKGSVIYVPVDNEALTSKIRLIMTKNEAMEFIRSFPSVEHLKWEDGNRRRTECFKNLLHSGEKYNLVRLIRTIYAQRIKQREIGKKLYLSDENIFTRAEQMLYSEISEIFAIPYDDVTSFIESVIEN